MRLLAIDPVAIRKSLAASRARSESFVRAWTTATSELVLDSDGRLVLKFMRKHFDAAYHNDPSPFGRCKVPERDVSAALGSMFPRAAAKPEPSVSHDHEFCRSGDGCDRPAVMGRYGRTFCERHGQELEVLAKRLRLDIDAANPRKSGNASLSRAA